MADGKTGSVLRRLAQAVRPVVASAPVTPSRALRMALTRAAQDQIGLSITVLGITEEVVALDDLLRLIDADMLLIGLEDREGLGGLAGIDFQSRAAVIEMQTMGQLRGSPADPRPVTSTDAALTGPFIAGFLDELSQNTQGTPLQGWVDDYAVGGRVDGLRAAGLALREARYRLVRLTIDLGIAERQGAILLALPVTREAVPAPATDPGHAWADLLGASVAQAPANLHAVLHRMRLPLHAVEAFRVGQIVSLPGIGVGSVRLEGPDGRVVARARLGQSAGLRAVRLTLQPAAEMSEAAHGTVTPRDRPVLPRS